VLSRVVGTGHGRVSEFCYFVTFAVPWTLADPGHIQVHPYSNRYSNPLKFGAVCERPPTFTKRLELRKLAPTHVCEHTSFDWGSSGRRFKSCQPDREKSSELV
jgi:hypothetical protein